MRLRKDISVHGKRSALNPDPETVLEVSDMQPPGSGRLYNICMSTENGSSHTISLRELMIILMVICWLIPIAAVAVIFGTMLTRSYEDAQQEMIESSVQSAFRQLDIRMSDIITDSKNVSYDGIVRSSYRNYQLDGDPAALYSRVNEYLNQRFSRNETYKAVFISFMTGINLSSYVISPSLSEYTMVRSYRNDAEQTIMENMADADTGIRFFALNDELYMARNLLDGKFIPYATVVMQCDRDILFNSFEEFPGGVITEIRIDGENLTFGEKPEPESDFNFQEYSENISGHNVAAVYAFSRFRIWRDVPSLKYGILMAVALGIPMLLIAVLVFYRQVTRPAQILLDATEHMTAGERGYQISEKPGNDEFRQLTERFNDMSAEMKNQFEQLYREQQALQRAKIKALQSQINPHFLNNTLEVINWEARMADDEKVAAMIEALSTMLDAAMDRDGKGMIPLSQEIGYVDAYLYIIRERLGERFHAEKEIAPGMDEVIIPRLILQPIVENAVEHDITPNGGGSILIRAFRKDGLIVLETSHSGTLTDEDREKIRQISEAASSGSGSKVGLQNVAERMKLIYGEKGVLSCEESDGMIRMILCFPESFAG